MSNDNDAVSGREYFKQHGTKYVHATTITKNGKTWYRRAVCGGLVGYGYMTRDGKRPTFPVALEFDVDSPLACKRCAAYVKANP